MPPMDWRSFLETLYGVAVAAAHPKICLPVHLPDPSEYASVKVIALGKAAAASIQILEEHWRGIEMSGVAVAPNIGRVTSDIFDIYETSHPMPERKALKAAKAVLETAEEAGKDDLLLVLLSGGASACCFAPIDGLDLSEVQRLTGDLMAAGASISEINTVRKHLSLIKGGRLAVAGGKARRLLTLAISDVAGDDPAIIGSGPTVAATSTIDDAKAVLAKYGIVYDGPFSACPPEDHQAFSKCEYRIIANAQASLSTAARFAENMNVHPQIMGADITGDAEIAGKGQARFIERLMSRQGSRAKLLLSGGEYTTRVTGSGEGGPNQHFLLSILSNLSAPIDLYALAADTDGQDGSGKAAGAWITPETFGRVIAEGMDPEIYLKNCDSFHFFERLESIIFAGPTHTNVNDFRAILIPPLTPRLAPDD